MSWSRRSRQERGYGAWWEKLRLVVLERDHYLCQCPQCKGADGELLRVRIAHEVDHIIPKANFADGRAKGDPDDMANLRAVNRHCHRRLTLEQRGFKPMQRFDKRGYPLGGGIEGKHRGEEGTVIEESCMPQHLKIPDSE